MVDCRINWSDNAYNSQLVKIYHQKIRSLRYKMSELLCHLSNNLPHILCITEHHLTHAELTFLHVDSYVLRSSYCRKVKSKGGVCIFIHNNLKFTSIDIEEHCAEQDFEACAVHLNTKHGAICIVAIYRSPQGNFNKFIANLDIIMHKCYNYNYTPIICGDINVDYHTKNVKKINLTEFYTLTISAVLLTFPLG